MKLSGNALIALWNDCASHRHDYDTWHTREHVPERLSVPGFLSGFRFHHGEGPLPAFFTLYSVADIGVLESEPYRALLKHPTAWSLSMRPDFSRFLRLVCHRRISVGGGLGGNLAVFILERSTSEDVLRRCVAEVTRIAAVTAVHYAAADRSSPSVPFSVAAETLDEAQAVLMVEGYDGGTLRAAERRIEAAMAEVGTLTRASYYELAFALTADERDLVPNYSPKEYFKAT